MSSCVITTANICIYKAHTIIVFFYPQTLERALSRVKKCECSKKCNKLFNNISMKTMCSLHFNPEIKKIIEGVKVDGSDLGSGFGSATPTLVEPTVSP
jgi:hypothetical protein